MFVPHLCIATELDSWLWVSDATTHTRLWSRLPEESHIRFVIFSVPSISNAGALFWLNVDNVQNLDCMRVLEMWVLTFHPLLCNREQCKGIAMQLREFI